MKEGPIRGPRTLSDCDCLVQLDEQEYKQFEGRGRNILKNVYIAVGSANGSSRIGRNGPHGRSRLGLAENCREKQDIE